MCLVSGPTSALDNLNTCRVMSISSSSGGGGDRVGGRKKGSSVGSAGEEVLRSPLSPRCSTPGWPPLGSAASKVISSISQLLMLLD